MKRLNLIALGVFVLVVVGVFQFRPETTERIQSAALAVFGGAHEAASALTANPDVINGVDIAPGTLTEKYSEEELAEKYSRLLREVGELRRIRSQFNAIQEENDKLRLALDFKLNYRYRDRMVAARVIKRDASTWWNTMDIDKGAEEGLLPDSPVLSYSGALVGKVIRVSKGTATVLLLTDEQCQVAARVLGTLEQGIVMGTRTSIGQEKPELRLKFLSKNADIQPKAEEPAPEIFTSGIPAEDKVTELGVFPSGLKLGTVASFTQGELYGEAVIDPAVDFSSISDVFVVLSQVAQDSAASPVSDPPRVVPEEHGVPALTQEVLDEIPTARPVAPPRAEPVDPASLEE